MATTINSTFTLNTSTGTDPVNISIAPAFSITDPTASGSITTVASQDHTVLSASVTTDTYVMVRNTGASTAGNVLVTDGTTPNNIALLKPQDFLFMPVKGSIGLRVKYDTAVTTLEWFYWTRA